MLNPLVVAARGLLASVFVTGGIGQLQGAKFLAPQVEAAKERYGVDVSLDGTELVQLNGAGMVAAGTTLALGIMPRTSALALGAMLVPTTVVGHAYWDHTGGKRMQHRSGFYANAAILGGLLMVVARRK